MNIALSVRSSESMVTVMNFKPEDGRERPRDSQSPVAPGVRGVSTRARSSSDSLPALTHYAHPRCLDKTWCGAEREPNPYQWNREDADCVVCAELRQLLGSDGWKMGLA